MKELQAFHHYNGTHAQARLPIEALEEEVVDLLLSASSVADVDRDSSICFELKHSSAVTQFSRLLAHKRDLPVDVCAAGALLHDIYVITSGSYTDHAHRGTPIARAMLDRVGGFSETEKQAAERIVWHHSDKHIFSSDPFAEFGKDVDVLDAFLYPGAFDWYLGNKPLPIFRHTSLVLPLCGVTWAWSQTDGFVYSRTTIMTGWRQAASYRWLNGARGSPPIRSTTCHRAWLYATARAGPRSTASARGPA